MRHTTDVRGDRHSNGFSEARLDGYRNVDDRQGELSRAGSAGPRVAVVSSIAPPEFGGGGLSATKLAVRLMERSKLAFLVTRSTARLRGHRAYQDTSGLPALPAERFSRVAPVRFKYRGRHPLLRIAATLLEPVDLALLGASTASLLIRKRREYDLLHCFTANWLSFFAICVGRLLGKRTMLELTLLGRDDPSGTAHERSRIKSLSRRVQYSLADGLVCISPALVTRCLRAGIPPEKLHLVPRPVDVRRFRPALDAELAALTERLGLSGRYPVVLFVGGITTRKGADLLLPAFASVLESYPHGVLVIVGTPDDAELYDRMREEMGRLPTGDAVRFIERTGRIDHYMRVADVFLLPTRREGFANVIVEAMASGTPAIIRRIPGITDYIIRDGEDGILVDGDDPEDYARAILRVMDSPELRRQLRETAMRTAHLRFRTAMIDERYNQLYLRLMETARGPFGKGSPGKARPTRAHRVGSAPGAAR